MSLKPVPTWPQCTRCAVVLDGEDERAELRWTAGRDLPYIPAMTHDWLRQDLIFTHSGVRTPGRYSESARLATMPSMPDLRATSKSAIPSRSTCSANRMCGKSTMVSRNVFLRMRSSVDEQVPPFELHEVEGDERDGVLGGEAPCVALPRNVDALLQTLERRPAFGVEDRQLAVNDGLSRLDPRAYRRASG